MQTHVLRLTGALALSIVGILAARSPKNDQPTVTFGASPPAEQNAIDVLAATHRGFIDYSQLGVNSATDSTVKQFAMTEVKDHGELLKAVQGVASKLNVIPQMSDKAADINKEFKKDINDLKPKKNGHDFDKEFMDEEIDQHQETIDVLKDLSEKTKDATVKGVVTEALSRMQAHLDRAKLVRNKFG